MKSWARRRPAKQATIEVSVPAVLIIDDDPAARRMMRRILADANYQVIEAENGVEGVGQFRTRAPELVITDIVMPEKEGIQTITEIRAMGSTVGVIAVSGGGPGAGDLYLSMAEELGADAVLAKPFRPSELMALVNQLIARNLAGPAPPKRA